MIIAIDGPSGAGKSTVAKAVARELGFSCLDTGAMYRAVAWRALQDGVPFDDDEALGRLARAHDIAFAHEEGEPVPRRVSIGGIDVTDAIRTAEIDRAVSPVSAAPSVRAALVEQQQRIGRAGDYVVEGRDIGTTVFPEAPVKVFLTASAEERAHRRVRQNVDRGVGSVDYDEVRRSGLLARHLAFAPGRRCRAPGFHRPLHRRGHRGHLRARPREGRAMSLFLPYEKMWDMPLGGTSDEKQVPHWAGNLIWGFLAFVFKICFRYRVDHRESLRGFKDKTGVVVVGNHTSFLDVAFMYLAGRPSQWVRFLGRENLFGNAHGLVGQVLSRVGAFPIKRDAADRTAIKRATRMLKSNEIVGIMPEGTRRGKSDRTPELHSGAAFIAKMGHAPILPMTVRNAEHVKHKGERFRFPKITIEYGDPVLVEDFDFLPKEDRLDGCSWYAMRECFALSLNVPREQVDMPALFPGGKDFTAVFAEHPVPHHTTAEVVAGIEAKAAAKAAKAAKVQEIA